MNFKFNKKMHSQKTGFTLIELIIIIVIVGILAAITILGFGSWRTRVAETEVRNDASGVKSGMEDARNRNNAYPVFIGGTQFDGGDSTKGVFVASNNVLITYIMGDAQGYCIDIQSKEVPSMHLFVDTSSGSDEPQSGTCLGGVGAIPPNSNETVFVFNTAAPGCTGTAQLPISAPTSGGTINWGDGSTEALSSSLQSHTYASPGVYQVTYQGPITAASYYPSVNTTNAKCLVRVAQWGGQVSPTAVNFAHSSNLTNVARPPLTATNLSYMFLNATSFNQPIDSWNVSNVTSMMSMFNGASSFNQPLASWNTSSVTTMQSMFAYATNFNQPIGSWNVSNVVTASIMFRDATSFNQPLASWNTSKLQAVISMFWNASSFNQNISNWNVTSINPSMKANFHLNAPLVQSNCPATLW